MKGLCPLLENEIHACDLRCTFPIASIGQDHQDSHEKEPHVPDEYIPELPLKRKFSMPPPAVFSRKVSPRAQYEPTVSYMNANM